MLLGINGLITEVRKEYVSGNQQFPTGQVYFGFVVQFFFFFSFSNQTTNTSEGRMID